MKKIIIFTFLLFLLVGVAYASEDMNTTLSESSEEPVSIDNHEVLKANETSAGDDSSKSNPVSEKPTLASNDITSKQGKTITLKTLVTNSNGPVSGVTVTFKLNGNTYTGVSGSDGVASVKVKCPSSAVLKTTSKTKGKTLTKTTTYSKIYTCSVSADGVKTTFKVISKKNKVVHKFKVTKKNKVLTIKVKNGDKIYKKGNYAFATSKKTINGVTYINVAGAGKNEGGYIKFFIKDHLKQNGKWKWSKWFKVPKNKIFDGTYPKNIKLDKIKIKYTHMTYKQIK